MTSSTMPRPARAPRPIAPGAVSRTNKLTNLDKERHQQGWFVFMMILFLVVGFTMIGFFSYIVLLG